VSSVFGSRCSLPPVSRSVSSLKPFTRCFRICRDITFPAPPKPIPVNPRGRAPEQLEGMVKNFFPVGFLNESLKDELKRDDRQGRILRSTSARPASPRVLPLHGFDINEWRPKAKAASSKSSSASDAEAARKRAKKEKKRAAESAGVEANQAASKKQKSGQDEQGEKKKKSKKDSKDKQ
jgi:type IV secretory pathway VirB10-like protein